MRCVLLLYLGWGKRIETLENLGCVNLEVLKLATQVSYVHRLVHDVDAVVFSVVWVDKLLLARIKEVH